MFKEDIFKLDANSNGNREKQEQFLRNYPSSIQPNEASVGPLGPVNLSCLLALALRARPGGRSGS